MRKTVCSVLGAGLLVACSGLVPLPEEYAAELPPAVELDAEERAEVTRETRAATDQMRAGNFAAAREAAERALDLDPRAARARAVRGRCLVEEARDETPPTLALWQEAEGELLLAHRLDPADPEIALLRGEFLRLDGHLSAAVEVLDRALEQTPRHSGCLRLAASLHYELGEERAALPLFQRLLESDPDDPDTLYRTAQCQLQLADTGSRETEDADEVQELYGRAAATFASYRKVAPQDAAGFSGEAYARLAAVQSRGGTPAGAELDAVLELYRKAATLSRLAPEHEFNLGVALELRGDDALAREAYERAMTRDPEHLQSLLNLAASLAAAGREAEAVPYCRRALRLGVTTDEQRRLEEFLRAQGALKRP